MEVARFLYTQEQKIEAAIGVLGSGTKSMPMLFFCIFATFSPFGHTEGGSSLQEDNNYGCCSWNENKRIWKFCSQNRMRFRHFGAAFPVSDFREICFSHQICKFRKRAALIGCVLKRQFFSLSFVDTTKNFFSCSAPALSKCL